MVGLVGYLVGWLVDYLTINYLAVAAYLNGWLVDYLADYLNGSRKGGWK